MMGGFISKSGCCNDPMSKGRSTKTSLPWSALPCRGLTLVPTLEFLTKKLINLN